MGSRNVGQYLGLLVTGQEDERPDRGRGRYCHARRSRQIIDLASRHSRENAEFPLQGSRDAYVFELSWVGAHLLAPGLLLESIHGTHTRVHPRLTLHVLDLIVQLNQKRGHNRTRIERGREQDLSVLFLPKSYPSSNLYHTPTRQMLQHCRR